MAFHQRMMMKRIVLWLPKSKAKGKKLDLSKVKFFHCHEHGHLTTNCPQKKKVAGASTGEASSLQFELISL